MLVLICGLPNAGKTTYSQRYANVIHLDDYSVPRVAHCNKAIEKAGDDIVVEGIYNTRCDREELLEAYRGQGKKTCIWLATPAEECIRRENRGRPQQVVLNQQKRFEEPSLSEGWDEIVVVSK